MNKVYKYTMVKYMKSPSTWIILVLGILFMAGLAGFMPLWVATKDKDSISSVTLSLRLKSAMTLTYLSIGGTVAMLTAIWSGFKGAQVFKDEVEDGTFLIMLSKPISRKKVIFMKWLAYISAMVAFEIIAVFSHNMGMLVGDKTHTVGSDYIGKAFFVELACALVFGFLYSSIALMISTYLGTGATIGISIVIGIFVPLTGVLGMFAYQAPYHKNGTHGSKSGIASGDISLQREFADIEHPVKFDNIGEYYEHVGNEAIYVKDATSYEGYKWLSFFDFNYQAGLIFSLAYDSVTTKAERDMIVDVTSGQTGGIKWKQLVTDSLNKEKLTGSNVVLKKYLPGTPTKEVKSYAEQLFSSMDPKTLGLPKHTDMRVIWLKMVAGYNMWIAENMPEMEKDLCPKFVGSHSGPNTIDQAKLNDGSFGHAWKLFDLGVAKDATKYKTYVDSRNAETCGTVVPSTENTVYAKWLNFKASTAHPTGGKSDAIIVPTTYSPEDIGVWSLFKMGLIDIDALAAAAGNADMSTYTKLLAVLKGEKGISQFIKTHVDADGAKTILQDPSTKFIESLKHNKKLQKDPTSISAHDAAKLLTIWSGAAMQQLQGATNKPAIARVGSTVHRVLNSYTNFWMNQVDYPHDKEITGIMGTLIYSQTLPALISSLYATEGMESTYLTNAMQNKMWYPISREAGDFVKDINNSVPEKFQLSNENRELLKHHSIAISALPKGKQEFWKQAAKSVVVNGVAELRIDKVSILHMGVENNFLRTVRYVPFINKYGLLIVYLILAIIMVPLSYYVLSKQNFR